MLRGRTAPGGHGASLLLLTYNKGRQRFAVPLDKVLEVQALDSISPVPHVPDYITGVIHWRGAVLALVDIGRYFGIAESGLADLHVCIIVEAAGRRLAIAALEIEDVIAAPAAALLTPDLNLPAEWTLGVHEDNRLVLNVEAIVRDPNFAVVERP
jgi:purine-binding chemotaxis protein CheW